jgi:hypothetical protein
MKRMVFVGAVMGLAVLLAACGDTEEIAVRFNSSNAVEKVIEQQLGAESSFLESTSEDSTPKISESSEILPTPSGQEESEPAEAVDYDLTEMSTDMVYATVYQMMVDPEAYIGKRFRMEGNYAVTYYENKGRYFHFCVIRDAAACCAQGLEFVWEDGTHLYPDEYPEENADIIIEGTFEVYQEKETGPMFCRIENATLQVK